MKTLIKVFNVSSPLLYPFIWSVRSTTPRVCPEYAGGGLHQISRWRYKQFKTFKLDLLIMNGILINHWILVLIPT